MGTQGQTKRTHTIAFHSGRARENERIKSTDITINRQDVRAVHVNEQRLHLQKTMSYARLGREIKCVGVSRHQGSDDKYHQVQKWVAPAWTNGSIQTMRWCSPVGYPEPKPYQLVQYDILDVDLLCRAGELDVHTVELSPSIDPDINLLSTVPTTWLPKSSGLEAVGELDKWWGALSQPLRAWFNAVFWLHPCRLNRFLLAPGSIKHHHAYPHGLLIHTLDCAQRVFEAAKSDRLVNMDVLVMAALMHDLGKADEYVGLETSAVRLSDRGALIGHRMTTTEWLSVARSDLPTHLQVDEKIAMAVIHAINASNAPDWVGLRQPRTLEAFYLSSVDGLSGHCDLIKGLTKGHHFKNGYHSAFRGNIYISS